MMAGEIPPVQAIPVDAVLVPEVRFRALKPEQAEAIGQSIAAFGQFEPIAVTQLPGRVGYVLVDGWHRLEGCRRAGIEAIEARVVAPDLGPRVAREALSGIARARHDVFDRAAAIDALARLAREEAGLPPENDLRCGPREPAPIANRLAERAGKSALATVTKRLRWDERLAEAMNCGPRTIRRLRFIHLRTTREEREQLRAAGCADELVAIATFAGLDAARRERVFELLGGPPPITLTAALALLFAPIEEPSATEKAQNALFRKAERWTPLDRASFLQRWTALYHPDGRPRAGKGGTS